MSYPTRILSDERSALVAFTDTPELFGAEIRILAAIERYLGRALDKLPSGAGSSMLHVVGGDMGGGFEWRTARAYRTTVRRGITAIALDQDGKVLRLTTVWDGAMVAQGDIKTLTTLSIE